MWGHQEFCLGITPLRREQGIRLFGILGLLMVLTLVAPYVLLWVCGYPDAYGEFLESLFEDPEIGHMLWALALLIPVCIGLMWITGRAYLRLTPQGLEGYVPGATGMGLTGLSTGRWLIPWGAIRAVRLQIGAKNSLPAQVLNSHRLVIESDAGETQLAPFMWVAQGAPDHRLGLLEAFNLKGFDAAERIARAPLIQALEERGLEITEGAGTGEQVPAGYDLLKHRGMLTQLALFSTAGLYALLDGFFLGLYEPLEALPWWPFLNAAALVTVCCVLLGRGAPRTERLIVGMLTVAAVTAAVYPGLLRINALTAEGTEAIAYTATGQPGVFEAPRPGLPPLELDFSRLRAYWSEYPEGSQHEFVLLKGAGGFYQLDLQPLYAKTRAYYRKRD